jgi:hypothetical protein
MKRRDLISDGKRKLKLRTRNRELEKVPAVRKCLDYCKAQIQDNIEAERIASRRRGLANLID